MSITKHEGANTLALATDQEWWTEKQMAALAQIGVDRASNGDLAVFMHVCQRTGLDPFARQIYMIERQGKQTIQTGIDGMRLVARRAVDRTGEALAISAPEWCGPDGQWTDVWLAGEAPAAARVTVRRGSGTFAAVALWREYVQTKRNGEVTQMWATRPAGQLAKCAEALALRKACPQDLSGVYSEDEMAREERPRYQGGLSAALNRDSSPAPDAPPSEPPAPSGSAVEASAGEVQPEPLTERTRGAMFALFGEHGITDRDGQLAYIADVLGREFDSRADLSEDDGLRVEAALRAEPVDAETTEADQ